VRLPLPCGVPYKDPEKQKAYQRQWMQKRRKAWFDENGPCAECGSWKALELDHVDPSKKVDHKIWSWSKVRRLKELEKCQVLCGVCHTEKTASSLRRPIKHGAINGYKGYGCRCEACTDAQRLYQAAWRASRT